MNCDCAAFRQDLVNFSKDILVKGDGRPQWKVFEQFCIKYKRNDTKRSFRFRNRFCSQKICSFLVRKLNVFVRYHVTLSTLLMDLLTILYSEICAQSPVLRLLDASFLNDRETLRVMSALESFYLWSSDFMMLLSNFGLLSSLPIDSPHLTEALENEFDTFISEIAGYIPNIPSCLVREKAMELLAKGNFHHINDKAYGKRMFLVTMALRAVEISLSMSDAPVIDELISCLRMYFSATRDALISVFEVRSILYASFLLIDKLQLFNLCCKEFDKLMPECPAKIEPRKLTHLARCQIRQNLKTSNLPLPSAVEKLLLPKTLKSFLLGEVLDISKNKENVSSVTQRELELMISKE